MHHQYGISAVFAQISFQEKNSGGIQNVAFYLSYTTCNDINHKLEEETLDAVTPVHKCDHSNCQKGLLCLWA